MPKTLGEHAQKDISGHDVFRSWMSIVDRKIENLWPKFGKKIGCILQDLEDFCAVHEPGWKPLFGEGFRSASRQKMLYAQGRSAPGKIVTYKDGLRAKSRHQSSMAFDVWFEHDGKITWDVPDSIYEYYGHLCRLYKLSWGGDWKKFCDEPHCEWPTSDLESYRQAGIWQQKKGLI